MTKSAKGEGGRKAAPGQLWLHLPGMVREALYDTVIGAGRACVDEVMERERVALCGERYAHLADRQAQRAGHVASSLVLGVSTRGCARSLESSYRKRLRYVGSAKARSANGSSTPPSANWPN